MAYLPVKNPQKMEEKPFSEHLICDVMPLFNSPHSVTHKPTENGSISWL